MKLKKGILVNQFIFKVCSVIPVLWLLSLYTFVIACTIELDHFPIPSLDDPKYLGLNLLYSIVFFGMIACFYCIILWGFSYLIARFYYKQVLKKYTILFFIGFGLLLIQLFIDPYQIMYWYLD